MANIKKERFYFPQFQNVDMANWTLANECVARLYRIGLIDKVSYDAVMEIYLEYIDIDNLYGHWDEKKFPV